MSGKRTRLDGSRGKLQEADKENKRIFANLQVNTLNKELQDAHLFQLPNQIPFLQPESDSTRFTRSSLRPSLKHNDINSSKLISVLKEEIEIKYRNSETNQKYRFFTSKRLMRSPNTPSDGRDSSRSLGESASGETSFDSLLDSSRYNLYSQNLTRREAEDKSLNKNEIESLLGKLVRVVTNTPQAGKILNEKSSISHKLFVQLLKNVACDRSEEANKKVPSSQRFQDSETRIIGQQQPMPSKNCTSNSNPKRHRGFASSNQDQSSKKRSKQIGSSVGRPTTEMSSTRDKLQVSCTSKILKSSGMQPMRPGEFESLVGHTHNQRNLLSSNPHPVLKSSSRAKGSPPLAASSSMRGLLGGKLTLKQKSQLGDGSLTARGCEPPADTSPTRNDLLLMNNTARTLKKISSEVSPIENLRGIRLKGAQKPLEGSKNMLLSNKLDKSKLLAHQHASLKTFVTSSFAGLSLNQSGIISLAKAPSSRRQSPDDTGKLAKPAGSQSLLANPNSQAIQTALSGKPSLSTVLTSSSSTLQKKISSKMAANKPSLGAT